MLIAFYLVYCGQSTPQIFGCNFSYKDRYLIIRNIHVKLKEIYLRRLVIRRITYHVRKDSHSISCCHSSNVQRHSPL